MFKRYVPERNVKNQNRCKSSVIRAVKRSIVEQYPSLEEDIDDILPKKGDLTVAKCHPDPIQFIAVDGQPVFFSVKNGPFYPTLRLLHKYPDMMPVFRTDRGAIRFVLSGADIMCPGLTKEAAYMEEVEEGTPVAIFAEGKQHAMAVGVAIKSTADIRSTNKDIGVKSLHYLNDGLWQHPNLD